jgi:transcription elongation factor Elf1
MLAALAKHIGLKPENKAEGLCIRCNQEALPRCTTDAGRRDVEITGMCEICYDEIFMEDPEEPES